MISTPVRAQEAVVRVAARGVREARVVGGDARRRGDGPQGLGGLVDLGARAAVDDRRAALLEVVGDELQRGRGALVAAPPAAQL